MQILSREENHPTSYGRLQFIKAALIMQLKAGSNDYYSPLFIFAGRKGAVAHSQASYMHRFIKLCLLAAVLGRYPNCFKARMNSFRGWIEIKQGWAK